MLVCVLLAVHIYLEHSIFLFSNRYLTNENRNNGDVGSDCCVRRSYIHNIYIYIYLMMIILFYICMYLL